MAVFLNIVAFYNVEDISDFISFFTTIGDVINSTLTLTYFILILGFVLYGYFGIHNNYDAIYHKDKEIT